MHHIMHDDIASIISPYLIAYSVQQLHDDMARIISIAIKKCDKWCGQSPHNSGIYNLSDILIKSGKLNISCR